jgi:hypothetical protein
MEAKKKGEDSSRPVPLFGILRNPGFGTASCPCDWNRINGG